MAKRTKKSLMSKRAIGNLSLGLSIFLCAIAVGAQTELAYQAISAKNILQVDGPSAIVVMHSDDAVGLAGLKSVQSCVGQKIFVSEEKAFEGTRSVVLLKQYNDIGRIVGVHYGENGVCDFVQKAKLNRMS